MTSLTSPRRVAFCLTTLLTAVLSFTGSCSAFSFVCPQSQSRNRICFDSRAGCISSTFFYRDNTFSLRAETTGSQDQSTTKSTQTKEVLKPEDIGIAVAADADEEEWEYEEYTALKEEDFYASEWKAGTAWSSNPNKIEETWVRLVTKDNQLMAYWGDGAEGKWSLDASSQFLSVSKETFGGWFGKKIWAGAVDDFYYMQGTVRGWSPLLPASVLGEWQFKRLGVSDEERGTAPWFEEVENKIPEEEEEEKKEEEGTEDK
jgi:hypothetical protein